jgi:hypothetical protein
MALDYDRLVILDAEDLAEQGIGEAYRDLQQELLTYIAAPEPIRELDDPDAPSYSIVFRNENFVVYEPGLEAEGWGRATYIFFKIINYQLAGIPVRFYAVNGGNELGGMFLTPEECELARRELSNPTDWPYIPTMDSEWYGQPH